MKRVNLARTQDASTVRLTVDHPADLDVVRAVVAALGADAGLDEILNWLAAHPEVAALNAAHYAI